MKTTENFSERHSTRPNKPMNLYQYTEIRATNKCMSDGLTMVFLDYAPKMVTPGWIKYSLPTKQTRELVKTSNPDRFEDRGLKQAKWEQNLKSNSKTRDRFVVMDQAYPTALNFSLSLSLSLSLFLSKYLSFRVHLAYCSETWLYY